MGIASAFALRATADTSLHPSYRLLRSLSSEPHLRSGLCRRRRERSRSAWRSRAHRPSPELKRTVARGCQNNRAEIDVPNPREYPVCRCTRLRSALVSACYRRRDVSIESIELVVKRSTPEKVSRKEIASTAPEVVESRERSMEARMRRSGNTAPWPAEGLVGGKGKRNAERHQEGRIYFVHHGTPTHSQHQRILGLGFRARQGIINEWLRRNLNGCKARTRMCFLCKQALRRRK